MHNEREDMSREAFEAWWSHHGQFHRAGGGEYEKTFAFHAWQAAQADAFERAAKVCDELYDGGGTAYGCADAIRALAKEAT